MVHGSKFNFNQFFNELADTALIYLFFISYFEFSFAVSSICPTLAANK
jgi:hypothetical protein